MVDQADAEAVRGQLRDQRRQLLGLAVVEAGAGLVEEQERRLGRERHREAEPAQVAEGQRAGQASGVGPETDEVEDRIRRAPPPRRRAAAAAAVLAGDPHVLPGQSPGNDIAC